eukprot:COSAG06_NODE_46673_length_345_cov_0.658537_1_plen_48_part_10
MHPAAVFCTTRPIGYAGLLYSCLVLFMGEGRHARDTCAAWPVPPARYY